MTVNLARRRGTKAIRRKAIVAQKRLAESVENRRAARVRLGAGGPIRHCLLQHGLFETGIATLVLARQVYPGTLAVAYFLIDGFCLGVKDVCFRRMTTEEFELFVQVVDQSSQTLPVDPAYGRKLLGDAVLYAAQFGFPPHEDFAAVELLFGEVDAGACDEVFTFGMDGKPHYIPGPFDTPTLIERRMMQLYKACGADGFEFTLPLDSDDDSLDWEDGEIIDAEPEAVLQLTAVSGGG